MIAALWAFSLALPFVHALTIGLLGVPGGHRAARARRIGVALAPASVLPAAVVAVVADTGATLHLPWLLLGTHLQLDAVGRPLFLVASLLYAAALVAVHTARAERAAALSAFMLVSFVGNAVVFVAADAATFYGAFALMSLSAYGLVVHERTESALRAGRIYLVLTMLSEFMLLAAVLLVVAAGGAMLVDAPSAVAASEHRDVIVGLLLVGLGIKAGTVPLHVWLPLAHPAAPPPASAVLSGAMIKAGLVGWLRFLPIGEVEMVGWGLLLVSLALVGAFAALPAGLLQGDAKVALAYSSISQMGFLAVLVGTALAEPELAEACTLAAVVYAVHHGLAKGALFLGVTVWRTHGDGWIRWWVLAGLGFAALAVAGAPLGSGAVAKYAAKEAVETTAVLGVELIDLLPLVGTVSTVLLVRFAWLLLTGPRDAAWGVDGAVLSWSALVVGGIVLTWYLADVSAPAVRVPGLDAVTVWEATWPILLGLVLSGAGWWAHRQGRLPGRLRESIDVIPPGDVLVSELALLHRARDVGRAADRRLAPTLTALGARVTRAATGAVSVAVRTASSTESRLEGWRTSGVAVLVTTAVLAAVLWRWWT